MYKTRVYLAGAGCGDWKLITQRALELIKRADCVIYDYLVNPRLLKFAKDNCKLIYVGKKASKHTLSQDKINKLLVKQAKIYKVIVRLKGGDPFVFGRGAEEASYLKKNKISFEIIPGISSAIAAPSYAGIPLTERSKNASVGFITGHEDPAKIESNIDWQALAKALGTMVFLMGVGNLAKITKKLIAKGKPETTPVAVIQWGTLSKQKTVIGTLGNIVTLTKKKHITPPAVIIVGEVVNLRKQLNWYESRPLFGKRIIVTRTRDQASLLSDRLGDLGADVIEIPTIKIVSLCADKLVKEVFNNNHYDWIFFTSQNGVNEFLQVLIRINKDSRIFNKAKVCAIGSATAKSLNSLLAIKPDYVPDEFIAEAIVRRFSRFNNSGERVLILRAKKARNVLPVGLRKAGFKVKVIDLYDTRVPKESRTLLKDTFVKKIDLVTFTSSSTVNNFIKLAGKKYKRKLSDTRFASIGPVTTAALKNFGLRAHMRAKVYTISGLVEAIIKGHKR